MRLGETLLATERGVHGPEHIGQILDRLMQQKRYVYNALQGGQQTFDFGEGLDLDEEPMVLNPHSDLPHGKNGSTDITPLPSEETESHVERYRRELEELYGCEEEEDTGADTNSEENGVQPDDRSKQREAARHAASKKKKDKKLRIHRMVQNSRRRRG